MAEFHIEKQAAICNDVRKTYHRPLCTGRLNEISVHIESFTWIKVVDNNYLAQLRFDCTCSYIRCGDLIQHDEYLPNRP